MEARVRIDAANRGFADFLVNWLLSLHLKALCVNRFGLGTTLGPSCVRGYSTEGSPAAIRCACFVRRFLSTSLITPARGA